MAKSDLVLIASTLFLGTTAMLVPVVTEQLKRTIFAPKFKASFDCRPPYCHRTSWRSSANPDFNEPVFYCRFQLENIGRTQARRCECVMEELWIYDTAGCANRLENFSPVRMAVDADQPYFDLNPGRKIYCVLGHVSSPTYQAAVERTKAIDIPGTHDETALRFFLEMPKWFYVQPNCLVPGKYDVRLRVYSENAKPAYARFKIAWSGKWQDTEESFLRELVIEMLDKGR